MTDGPRYSGPSPPSPPRVADPRCGPRTLGPKLPDPRFHTTQSLRDPGAGNRGTPLDPSRAPAGPFEQSLYDDLRNDRLGDRVRLEQERVQYQRVEQAVLHC